MKSKIIFLFGILSVSLFIYSFTIESNENDNSFAIVELYTSQGCSSCPRADKVLEEIAEVYKNKNVIPLSFHVDYWDRLGWKDTFSKHEFSQRQYAYAESFKSAQVYTPQMIINGKTEFNGGNKTTAFRLIDTSIKKKGVVKFTGKINELSNELSVVYTISNTQYNLYNINVVLVKNKEKVAIKRGENSNRQILYNNIVIDLKTVKANKSGKVQLAKPNRYKKEEYTVILFLQEKDNGAIIGASKLEN